MALLRSFRLSTYLTLALSCLCLGYAEGDLLPETPYITAVVIVLIAVAHRVEGRWALSLQSANSVGAVLTVALLGWIAFQFWRGSTSVLDVLPFPANLLPYLGPVLMILIPAKLFRPKHVGDFWAIQGVGLLAVTLGCAMANDLFFTVLLMAYVFCFAWSLVLFYLYREIELEKSPEPGPAEAGPRWDLLGAASSWTLTVVAVGTVVFLLTPRPPDRKWELSMVGRVRLETGLGDGAVDLNRTGSLEQNPEVAFEVYADDAEGRPYLNLPAGQRWRAASLSRYEGGRWSREGTTGLVLQERTAPRSRPPGLPEQDRRLFRNNRLPDFGPRAFYLTYTLQRNAGGGNIVADPVVWRANDVPPVFVFNTRNGSVQQHQDGRFEWLNMIGPGRESYCQVTMPLPEPDLGPPLRVSGGYFDYLTWITSHDMGDRLRRWTGQVVERLVAEGRLPGAVLREADPVTRLPNERHHEAVAKALEDYLANSGEFVYTLDLGRKEKGIDPIEDFLYHTKAGHCQRYASALVMMLRSQGIPAQLVTGFRGCESMDEGHYVVRQSMAHAWVEALVPRSPPANVLPGRPDEPSGPPMAEAYHWLALDPTPSGDPTAYRPGGFRGWLEGARAWAESMFRSAILGYDSFARDQTIDAVATLFEEIWDGLAEPHFNGVKAGAGGVLVALGLWLGRRWRRRRRAAARRPVSAEEQTVAFHARLTALLAKHGAAPRLGQTAREFAAELAAEIAPFAPEASGTLSRLAEAFYRVRFGRLTLDEAELQQINTDLGRLELALADWQRAPA